MDGTIYEGPISGHDTTTPTRRGATKYKRAGTPTSMGQNGMGFIHSQVNRHERSEEGEAKCQRERPSIERR